MIIGNKHRVKPPTRGELKNPITIVRSRLSDDPVNSGLDETFALVANVWAKVARGRGMFLDNTEKQHEVTHNFIIDKDPEVKVQDGDFVVFEGRMYAIRSVMELEQGVEFWQLACTSDGNWADRMLDGTIIDPADPEESKAESEDFPFWV